MFSLGRGYKFTFFLGENIERNTEIQNQNTNKIMYTTCCRLAGGINSPLLYQSENINSEMEIEIQIYKI